MTKTYAVTYEYIIPETDTVTVEAEDIQDAEATAYEMLEETLPPEVKGVSIEMIKEVG